MSKIPGFLFLFAAAFCAVSAEAAKPVVTFETRALVATVTPGATVAIYAYGASASRQERAWRSSTDSDNDGVVRVEFTADLSAMYAVVADIATGEFSYASKTGSPYVLTLPPGSILPGPNGSYTRLILPRSIVIPMWIRPGVGMWLASFADEDGTNDNSVTFTTTSLHRIVASRWSRSCRLMSIQ